MIHFGGTDSRLTFHKSRWSLVRFDILIASSLSARFHPLLALPRLEAFPAIERYSGTAGVDYLAQISRRGDVAAIYLYLMKSWFGLLTEENMTRGLQQQQKWRASAVKESGGASGGEKS